MVVWQNVEGYGCSVGGQFSRWPLYTFFLIVSSTSEEKWEIRDLAADADLA